MRFLIPLNPETVKTALQEFANGKVAALRGSVGGEAVYANVVACLPGMVELVGFISRCKVAGATVALIAGDVPMVRVRLRDAKRTRTVSPSSWLSDLTVAYGMEAEGFDKYLRKILPPNRLLLLETEILNAKVAAFADKEQMADIRSKLDKKREFERQRLIRTVVQTFKSIPHDLLTEEDVIRLWRENVVRIVLDT